MFNTIALHRYPLQRKRFFHLLCCLGLFAFALLTGCSTVKRDGPPSYNVDVSHIPDAVPRVERLSRIGNRPYTVSGTKYYVLSSSKNYEQRGIASWYGTRFHGRYTSNGERYNMLAMTAAHKTLPLPTYVEVTNLKNNRKIIVKVTDRGPFSQNRLIDLSYAAAKKLDMLGHGTAPVDVRAIDPLRYDKNNSHAAYYLANADRHSTTLHLTYIRVGTFHNKVYAEKLKKRLLPVIGSPVNITQTARLNALYRVQIGPVRDAIKVAQIHRQLRSMGIKA